MSNQRYVATSKIGQGGLGEVYLARDTQLDREVALKRVRVPEGGNADAMADDLIREAKILSALQHPNIVTVYDVGRDADGSYVVMELLKGETLDAVIERGALQAEDFQRVVHQTLEGMIAAQAVGLVHRDLKPGNLMVIWLASGRFQIKILDFGLAKFSRKAGVQTEDQEGGIFGSIYFMAPEQFERLPLDARTDMYSLGCIYYQILTTRHPFEGETAVQVMASHLQHHVTPLKLLRKDLPEWLCHWVMWLISREMDDRPQDARTAMEYFQNQRHGLTNVLPEPRAVTAQIVRPGAAVPARGSAAPAPAPSGRQTQQVKTGSMATARISTPAAHRIKKKGGGPPLWVWILLGVLVVGGIVTGVLLNSSGGQKGGAELLAELAAQESPKGDATTVAQLCSLVNKSGPESPTAIKVLKRLKGEGIGDAIAKEAEKASPTAQRLLIECLIDQPSALAGPMLIKVALANPGPSRDAALKALVKCATGGDLPLLIKEQDKLQGDSARVAEIMEAVLGRLPDAAARVSALIPAMKESTGDLRTKLLVMLGQAGTPEAFSAIKLELTSTDAVAKKAAFAALPSMSGSAELAESILLAATGAEKESALASYFMMCALLPANGEDRVAAIKRAAKDAAGAAKTALQTALGAIADPAAVALAKELGLAPAVASSEALIKTAGKYAGGEVSLSAEKAVIIGGEASYSSTMKAIQNWTLPETKICWDIQFPEGGKYEVSVEQSLNMRRKREFRVLLGESGAVVEVKPTSSTEEFVMVNAGDFSVSKPGSYRLIIEPVTMEKGQPLMLVRSVTIRKK